MLNRAGTTFRKLPEADKQGLDRGEGDRGHAGPASTIKRPVVEIRGGKLLVGFKPEEWEAAVS